MCLLLLAVRAHPAYPLVIAANRDEFYERPTLAAHWWKDSPGVLAGRDLEGGGAWLGVTRSGRFAAVTNVRAEDPANPGAPSRGTLAGGFLRSDAPTEEFLEGLQVRMDDYAGFNLVIGSLLEVTALSNRNGNPRILGQGIHGIGNGPLGSPSPRVSRGIEAFGKILRGGEVEPERLLALLAEGRPLPGEGRSGEGQLEALERELSSIFVETPAYGTRSSTVLMVGEDGMVRFVERTTDPGVAPASATRAFTFQVEEPA